MHILRLIGVVFWSIFAITLSLIVLVIFLFNHHFSLKMARVFWSPMILFFSNVRLKVEGLENVNFSKPHIFVANHQSFIDIPCIFNALPINLYFVGKNELKKMPFIGWYMAAMKMIFIDRSDKRKAIESLSEAGNLIHNGKSVIMFPEGTRSKDGEIASFKRGTFLLAEKAQVQIVPMYLHNAGKVWSSNSWKIHGGEIVLKIGKPISIENLTEKNVLQFANDTREEVLKLKEAS